MATQHKAQKLRLAAKYGLQCWWCRRELHIEGDPKSPAYATRDHILKLELKVRKALDLKFIHSEDNIRLSCYKCNNERHAPDWKAPDNSNLTLVNETHDNPTS